MNSLNGKLRIAVVTTHPPSKGTLNEYGFHFVKALRQKPEVEEVILLLEELPDEQTYTLDDAGAPVTVRQCWRFGAWNNSLRIVKTVRDTKPDVVLFNIQFASFGSGKAAAALGLTAPTLVKAAGYPTVVLLHNIMETVDLNSAGFANNRLISALMEALVKVFLEILSKVPMTLEDARGDLEYNKQFYDFLLHGKKNEARELMIEHFQTLHEIIDRSKAEHTDGTHA